MEKTTLKKNKDGYGYKYTELAEIHKYLEENGMKYYQEIETDPNTGSDYIMTYRFINGEWEEKPKRGCKVVDATLQGVKNPAQEQGSALTYARRYSVLMAFGLATEDDDAQSLSQREEVTLEYAKSYKLSFGKHNGKLLTEVPQNYLDWLSENSKTDETIKQCIKLLNEEKGIPVLTEEEKEEQLLLMAKINTLMIETNTDWEKLLKHYKVSSSSEMTTEQLKDAVQKIENNGE